MIAVLNTGMADHATRRADRCREHVEKLTVEAARDINRNHRGYMLDLAATYRRVADGRQPARQ